VVVAAIAVLAVFAAAGLVWYRRRTP
jgi:hypothetical protein